ncbi:protein S40-5-like [Prosopis cineraria]|uniref:protein S40-5-like n=1 Tax=Prosopis cineraria TaxID=364024 RepID=UPI00240FFE0C|nr:protein S40-5-like [Prosopis cineraria]XP_054779349.1 protein S40-5-like [Prosopis cineraria]
MAAWDGVLSKTRLGDEEFDEEDVWGLADERDDSSPKVMKMLASKDSSGSSSAWLSPAAPRKIPRTNSQTSHKFEALQGSSAPLNIPDWSKIYQKNIKRGTKVDAGQEHDHDNGDEEEEDGDEDRIIPPHEWLARKLARNQISSFSVCEGVGRTLKGRDLSKVRNAILSKTGFIE